MHARYVAIYNYVASDNKNVWTYIDLLNLQYIFRYFNFETNGAS